MDYTPCAFSDSQHPHITTHAHELALTVLFESGLQHLADRPESYFSQPSSVQHFLMQLPASWDETRLLDGYPGEYVVMARRSGSTWYIAGINGSDSVREVALKGIDNRRPRRRDGNQAAPTGTLFLDDELAAGERIAHFSISENATLPATITCQPRGGFVIVLAAGN
jgi:hypothetical protein